MGLRGSIDRCRRRIHVYTPIYTPTPTYIHTHTYIHMYMNTTSQHVNMSTHQEVEDLVGEELGLDLVLELLLRHALPLRVEPLQVHLLLLSGVGRFGVCVCVCERFASTNPTRSSTPLLPTHRHPPAHTQPRHEPGPGGRAGPPPASPAPPPVVGFLNFGAFYHLS